MSFVWHDIRPPVIQETPASRSVSPSSKGISDPLGAAHVAVQLHAKLRLLGLRLTVGNDLAALNNFSLRLRGKPISPYFDPAVAGLPPERAFWMTLENASGKPVGMQAFRLDCVENSLAEWAQVYTIALYMRRQELVVPAEGTMPPTSIAGRISGRLVYQGDLYLENGSARNRNNIELFGKLGLVLTYLKWQPDAVWGLMAHRMATKGTSTRMGFAYIERGVLRWQTTSDGIDPVEWIAISERPALEQLIEQELLTRP
jgi:hypothetical protein